jgi:ParB-like chromosome segregation protein Spo0J
MKVSKLKLNPNNPRIIKDDKFHKLVESLKNFPEMMEKRPMVCVTDEDGKIYPLGGNMRLKAVQELKMKEIPDTWVLMADEWTEEQRKEFIIKDNVSFGEWNFDTLANEWDVEELTEWGLDIPNFEIEEVEEKEQNKKLSERFIIPPFSILNAKSGEWTQRKNYWLSLGIKSEEGRDNNLLESLNKLAKKSGQGEQKDNSIFDPVLCELAYKWFNVPNGKILDCFAGGSVRGIVAAKLGYEYLGNDLRSEQIDANRINAKEVLQDAEIYPTWTCGDSLNIDTIAKGYEADFLFSCPPYADLEVYSDLKEDISNMPYKDFITVYRDIIRKSCTLLKEDRFAVFVVGDVRDNKGFYQNFVSDTIQAFIDSGLLLYNEMILCTQIAAKALTVSKGFNASRKIGKVHQNVLVFYKGNPKNIKANYPKLDLSYIEEQNEIE